MILTKAEAVKLINKEGKHLNIPHGYTEIESEALLNQTDLESVIIPDSVTSIGDFAFQMTRDNNLISVTISKNAGSISRGMFSGCDKLESVVIPDSVKSIGELAFRGCSSLTSVTIPDGVESIGAKAFIGCDKLESVVIPDSVTSIGEQAFGTYIEKYDIFGNIIDENGKRYRFEYVKPELFIIYCSRRSYAHKYGKSNKIKVKKP